MHGLAEKQLFSWSQAFYRVEINKLNSTQQHPRERRLESAFQNADSKFANWA